MAGMKSSNLWGRIAVFLIIFGACAGTAMALSGSGTEADPWLIQSLADFDDFAADANYWDDYTRLETDVNLAGRVYERAVIAWDEQDGNYDFEGTYFTGVLDGNDHAVSNFVCNSNDRDYIGFIGHVGGPNTEIKNLMLANPNVSGDRFVGTLFGYNRGTVIDCHSTGKTRGRSSVGGLIGFNKGNVLDCSAAGEVRGDEYVGGLAGGNGTQLFADIPVGCPIWNCHSIGTVYGSDYVGGLVGMNWGVILGCYARSVVTGNDSVGGLIGYNERGVTHSYSDCSVDGQNEVGGLVGSHYCDYCSYPPMISNSYSLSNVQGGNSVGGLIGSIGRPRYLVGSTSLSYSAGQVSGGQNVGGLIGDAVSARAVYNSYWDTETSRIPNMCGNLSDPSCGGFLGRTTTEMKQQSTFTNWDFINVWNIGENQTYPYLRTVPAGDINKDKTVNFLDVCIIAQQWCNEE